ncbi:hypothetical protein VTN77DRAFT_2196 [Rasamsonia byssochlamydoides]|uniref:uncharacterized protein n=1 Tax=Rasamsonia byssochlamydoides TaxID=89139 RepID=UPI003741F2E5
MYCMNCLRQFFESTFTDEALFPPRCCQRLIDVELVRPLLTSEIVATFERRTEEINTADRTYCSSPDCPTFISPTTIADNRASCPRCHTVTCSICKRASHEGEDCPEDPVLQQVLQIAEERGWRRCLSCKRVVELIFGCNHITCICRTEFCYACGLRWKTCQCPIWDENRLLEAYPQRAGANNSGQNNNQNRPQGQPQLKLKLSLSLSNKSRGLTPLLIPLHNLTTNPPQKGTASMTDGDSSGAPTTAMNVTGVVNSSA